MFHGLPEDYNPKQIDPALLTFREWWNLVDPNQKCHPSSAYNLSVKDFSERGYLEKASFLKLMKTVTIQGIKFEIRAKVEKIGPRVKTDTQGDILRVDSEVQYYSDDEIKRLGWKQYEWTLAVFDREQPVASVQDEWGCMLIMVAREYRSFGLGALLLKIGYAIHPDKPSGGMTPAGFRTFARVHAEFVRDALQNGLYTKMVRQRRMTVERVKEIIGSTKPSTTKQVQNYNLQSDNPEDWLMYVGEYGDYIIYDRKLRDLLTAGDKYDYFTEKMIKGIMYVMILENRSVAFPKVFGGDTPQIRRLLMSCAIEYARRHNVNFYVEDDDANDVVPDMGTLEEPNNVIGFRSQKVNPTGKSLAYEGFANAERQWRKQFDQYDEFKNQMMEMAYSKYQ